MRAFRLRAADAIGLASQTLIWTPDLPVIAGSVRVTVAPIETTLELWASELHGAEAAGNPGPWRQQAVPGRGRWAADSLCATSCATTR